MTCDLQPDRTKLWFWSFRLLPAFWLGGLCIGFFLYSSACADYFSLMRGEFSVSIVGILLSSVFPILISAVAVLIHKPWILLGFAFFKACLFGLVSIVLLQCFGEGGWLVRRFLMFHELCSFPVYYIFLHRCLRIRRLPSPCECICWICLQVLIIDLDYHVISPFFTGLTIL